MLDALTLLSQDDLFRLEETRTLPYEKFDSVWVSVTIEMNLNLMQLER